MDNLLFFFLENMALIIALMYMGLRGKEMLSLEMKNSAQLLWAYSLFINFMTVSVMYHPYQHEGMRLDLREVPIFFISYIGGWKFGILSSIVPTAFRIYLGGPTVVQGLLQSIVLPILIGAAFHLKKPSNQVFLLIRLKRLLAGFVLYEAIKTAAILGTTPMTPFIAFTMFGFAVIAVLAMALMLNEENRNLLLKSELEVYSNQDPLTQLPNIRFFKNKVENLLAQNVPISIVMLDVDYFKNFNDTNGHQKGDKVLVQLGELLKDTVRKDDVVARYGGEEFIICFTDALKSEGIETVADRFRQKVADYRFEGEENQPGGNLTISLGMSFSSRDKTLTHIIEEADQALYRSKKLGRNRITVYSGEEINVL